jgi:hypothetical protein
MSLKITPEHYAYMKEKLRLQVMLVSIPTRRALLCSDPRVRDAGKRLRWDMLYQAGLSPWICAALYPYMDDSHIDSALKQIVKELEA